MCLYGFAGVVNAAAKRRSLVCGLNMVFLGLAIAIFAWGTNYKISLYDPPSTATHGIPPAKLLSSDQQVTATKGPIRHTPPNPATKGAGTCFLEAPGEFFAQQIQGIWFAPAPVRQGSAALKLGSLRRLMALSTSGFRPPPFAR